MNSHSIKKYSFGWLKDNPDMRDYTVRTDRASSKLLKIGKRESIRSILSKSLEKKAVANTMPRNIDLRDFCPPIEDQENLNSCTANAVAGLVEYWERKTFSRHINASRLFLYKTTRNLLGWTGDTGAYLRTTMGALAIFGAPPEDIYPYQVKNFEKEPSAFFYSYAQNYQSLQYYRLDPLGSNPSIVLNEIKTHLSSGFPCVFGFACYSSLTNNVVTNSGKIPYPGSSEQNIGGHAVMAVGYNDDIKITNTSSNTITTGALIIRNSWGSEWGENGYGYLPYDYVIGELADDFWCLISSEWVDNLNYQV